MAPLRQRQLAALSLALVAALSPAHAAESLQLVEQEIKAGLLYNFLRYTDWPIGPVAAPPATAMDSAATAPAAAQEPAAVVAPPAPSPMPTAATAAPMVVCLLGGDPFSGRLQPMAGRTVNQRAIEIKLLTPTDDKAVCSLLVIHGDLKPQWTELRAALADKPMLTVSDFDGFSDAGGMIEFTRTDNRIGVKINTDALMAAHLTVQDRLLKLASNTRGGGR